ncbi:MAG: hypothetical protein K6E45_06310 [Bacteroidaceae bacterium]|nr:hypothetical protein [Bacteroidaceae bacterium]
MEYMEDILVPIAICCVLPIVVVWLVYRQKIMVSRDRTRIVLAAIEKIEQNPDMDIEELMKKISPKKKLLKEKLLTKLLWGSIVAFLGIALLGFCVVQAYVGGMPTAALQQFSLFGAVLLGIGIAFLINYYVGKKLLAKEIDAEEKLMVSQAENK